MHQHQLDFMEDFEKQEGVAFFIVFFSVFDKMLLIPYRFIKEKVGLAKSGGPKSIPFEECDQFYEIENKDGYIVHYIEALDRYLHDM